MRTFIAAAALLSLTGLATAQQSTVEGQAGSAVQISQASAKADATASAMSRLQLQVWR